MCARPTLRSLLSPRALLAFLLLAPAGLLSAEEPDEIVTARMMWEPGRVGPGSNGRIPWQDAPPADVKAPTGLKMARFSRIKMADGKGLALAFDATPETMRLWVDHDFDGDLVEEKPLHLLKKERVWSRTTTVLAPYTDEPDPVPLHLTFIHRLPPEPLPVIEGQPAPKPVPPPAADNLEVACPIHRRGSLELGGRMRVVALADRTHDVRFDDTERDALYLDLDGDGQIQGSGPGHERIPIGTPIRLGDEGWVAEVTSASGIAVTFTRTAKTPPHRERPWVDAKPPASGMAKPRPADDLSTLRKRFHTQRGLPYDERAKAVRDIGAHGTSEAFSFLMHVADNDDALEVRGYALRALGNPAFLPQGDRVAAMARKARSVEATHLAAALHAMGYPEREAVFLDMLDGSDVNAVGAAARGLAWLRTPKAIKAIHRKLREGTSGALRVRAYVDGIRNLPGGPTKKLLRATLQDADPTVRGEAIRDLYRLGDPSARKEALTLAKVRPVNPNAARALAVVLGAEVDAKAVSALLMLFEDPKLHPVPRQEIVAHLRPLRTAESTQVFVKALKHKVPVIRSVAVSVLSAIPRPEVTDALIKRIKREKDERILPRIYEALGDHGSERAVPILLKRAKRKKREPAQEAATRGLARIGFGHPKVEAFLIGLLSSRHPDDVILALDAAAASQDESLLSKILPHLGAKTWRVRLTAAQALSRIRHLDAIDALIAALRAEPESRVQEALADALFVTTGMNLYADAEVWARWWAAHKEGFEVPADLPQRPEAEEGGTQEAGFYGIPVRSRRVLFLIDQSGSMIAPGGPPPDEKSDPPNRLDVAVEAVLGAVAKLDTKAHVNVILFHTAIAPWRKQLQRMDKVNRKKLSSYLRKQKPAGGTNLYDGLESALRVPDVDTVFVLSDGVPGLGKHVSMPAILRGVRRENQTRRIAIHAVSIGMDSELLRRLAAENGGRYLRR